MLEGQLFSRIKKVDPLDINSITHCIFKLDEPKIGSSVSVEVQKSAEPKAESAGKFPFLARIQIRVALL